MDIVRILRVVEYIGPRDLIENQVNTSLHGTKMFGPGNAIKISAATIGTFPEIMQGNTAEEVGESV